MSVVTYLVTRLKIYRCDSSLVSMITMDSNDYKDSKDSSDSIILSMILFSFHKHFHEVCFPECFHTFDSFAKHINIQIAIDLNIF